MKENYSQEIEAFKLKAKKITPAPPKWLKLREACLAKFGEEEGLNRFKAWQKGKWIQFQEYGS